MYDTSPESSPKVEASDLAHYDSFVDSTESPAPILQHALRHENTSILTISADGQYIYSGSQAREIHVWDRKSLRIKGRLEGHTGSVLMLETYEAKNWLFSASGDSTVRIWNTLSLTPLYVIIPYLDTDNGDIYSLTFSPKLSTLYFGCQNTSIQWLDLSSIIAATSNSNHLPIRSDSSSTPGTPKRFHKFFDSLPKAQARAQAQKEALQSTPLLAVTTEPTDTQSSGVSELHVPSTNVVLSHYGYVYSMALSPSHLYAADKSCYSEETYLLTGSGDEEVKLWLATKDGLTEKHTFTGGDGGVLSLVARQGTIYAGCQDGHIKVWDIETKTLLRTLLVDCPRSPDSGNRDRSLDILSLSMVGGDLYACLGNGWVQRWSSNFESTALWKAHERIALSSVITSPIGHEYQNNKYNAMLLTGGADSEIKLWSVEIPQTSRREQIEQGTIKAENDLQTALAEFVAFPSIVGVESAREDCRQAALWLKQLLQQLGAEASLLPTSPDVNPSVLATFTGSERCPSRPRILFYGHYDVIPAKRHGWESKPFTLTGKNGYLYGRGVSDNKGPILAAAFAISELRRRSALGLDVVFLIEGEEEAGSRGFEEIVKQHRDAIGQVDVILVSNSYWIGEDRPCITYGLRGVVHAKVEITSAGPDLHSGVEGGGVTEPMFDMVAILNSLSPGGKISIAHFYDNVRPQSEEEKKLYELLENVTGQSKEYLTAKWREPSLSIHSVETSGPGNRTVIPSSVRAQLSVRIVPDQDLSRIAQSLEDHIHVSFANLHSPNTLQVSIDKAADWWLGNLEGCYFLALERAIEEEWGDKPLRIREGGSIPSIPFLEKTFGCPALHLPLGQSSDQAHLANERISVNNLLKGKAVLERFFKSIAQKCNDA